MQQSIPGRNLPRDTLPSGPGVGGVDRNVIEPAYEMSAGIQLRPFLLLLVSKAMASELERSLFTAGEVQTPTRTTTYEMIIAKQAKEA